MARAAAETLAEAAVGRDQRQIGGYSTSRGWGGSGGVGFEPDGAELVAGGEAHVGVERGG